MIINRDQRWIYLGPPKTASTTLHRELRRGWSGQWRQRGVQHDMDIPEDCQDFFTFVSIRDPRSRAVSLWFQFLRDRRVKDNPDVDRFDRRKLPLDMKTWPFSRFLRRLVAGALEDYYVFTIVRWLKWVPRVDMVLRQECLSEDFAKLPFVQQPVLLARDNSPRKYRWEAIYSPEDWAVADHWGCPDVERFGYRR